jgi:hypothetical protein
LTYVDSGGTQQTLVLTPSAAKADGTSATLGVPTDANGAFRLQVFGSSVQPLLQIVPVVTAVADNGASLTLTGGGFVEGAASYTVAGTTVTDTSAANGPDVQSYNYDNNRVSLPEPAHGPGALTVTTAGGTSAAVTVNDVYPALGGLGDVAYDAGGKTLWVIDSNSPATISQLNAATGAVLKTIALPTARPMATTAACRWSPRPSA